MLTWPLLIGRLHQSLYTKEFDHFLSLFMANDEAAGAEVVLEATDGAAPAARSFRVSRFEGYKNGFFLPFFCCLMLLFWITCGFAGICLCPFCCCLLILMVAPSDTIEFNNETRMLVSHSYPPVEYERVRMEAMYFPVSHTVHVYIFLDDVKPLPFRRGVRWLLHSPRIQDPSLNCPCEEVDQMQT